MKEVKAKKFKILYGSIFIGGLIANIPFGISIFIESLNILKVIFITVVGVEILLFLIFTTIFASERFHKDFIAEWKVYFNKRRRSFGILLIIIVVLALLTGTIKTWQLSM